MPVILKIKRGTTAQWTASTTPLQAGELGYDTQTKTIKIGDGTTLWPALLPVNKFEIDEISQDAIYEALTNFVSIGNNITVTYDDPNNSIVLDTGPNVALLSDLSNTLTDANEYTDLAVSGLLNQVGGDYVPVADVGSPDGVAGLDSEGYVPDSQLSPSIARDSEIITSYNDLTDKPTIALAAVNWTANHFQLEGGANTRYLAGDIVYDTGSIYVANFDNESLPTSNTQYWTNIGSGNRLNIDGRDIPNIIWENILNKPTLFDGNYNSLSNLPTLFSGSYTDLTDKPALFDGDYNSLSNTPTLFSGSYDDLTDKPTIPDLTGYATETYVNTAVSNLVDSAPETLNTLNELAAALGDDANYASTITTALGGKLDISHESDTTNIHGIADTSKLVTTDGSQTLSNKTVSGLTLSGNISVANDTTLSGAMLLGGSLFPQTLGIPTGTTITSPVLSGTFDFTGVTVSGLTKSTVGLSNVDNTSDADKPVSTATQTELNKKSDKLTSINAQSSSYTIATSDLGKMIEMSNGGTLTISDSSSFEVGFTVDVLQTGSSQVTIAGSGFTPNGTPGLKLRAQWSSATLIKRALNSWVVVGDLSA